MLMALIDEVGEVLGRTVAAGGGIQARGLITPGAVEGIFGDRQQFEMGEAHLLDVGHQLLGQFAIGQIAIAFTAPPGAQMHFIDAHRLVQLIGAGALFHPALILPLVLRQAMHQGGGRRRALSLKGKGSALSGSRRPSGPLISYL